jgi:hypothetical protein
MCSRTKRTKGYKADSPQMNFALAHVLGSTLQTALLNSSLVVIVGWGLSQDMVRFSGAEAKYILANGTVEPQLLRLPDRPPHPRHPLRRQLPP